MADRLFVAVIGSRNSGKSTTWNTLFGGTVKTGKWARTLSLGDGRSTEVFLISGSHEERELYAADVLKNVNCRIVLCSVQYVEEAIERTWSHIFEKGFAIYAQCGRLLYLYCVRDHRTVPECSFRKGKPA
jgi:hypothetical protein